METRTCAHDSRRRETRSIPATGGENNGSGNNNDNTPGEINSVSGLANKFEWLRNNARSGNSYTIEVNTNEIIDYQWILYAPNLSNVTVTLKGVGGNHTISPTYGSTALFNVLPGFTLVLDNITIKSNYSSTNFIAVNAQRDSTIIMKAGSAILGDLIGTQGNFIMDGGTIAGIGMSVDGNFTMNGGSISNNDGGVYVSKTFTMNGGTISNNGSGVSGNGTFTMNGGTISGTRNIGVSWSGGNFNMKSGIISNNGSGVSARGTFTMSDGTISNNGSGVSGGNGTFTMNGGTISGNRGTGVSWSGGNFNMKAGSITGNTEAGSGYAGGGVYVQDGIFNMSGGSISGNSTPPMGRWGSCDYWNF